jgi:polycomb protein EED
LDGSSGKLIRTLPGHGKGINDLAVSPLATYLLASASEDFTIRLWDLRPEYNNQPCVAVFSGEGHKQPILAVRFHSNGRWLLSGGLDTAVCLWAVPDLKHLERVVEKLEDHVNPRIIYYPHFFSTEVHDNYVDCLHFYGDLILSRAAKDQNAPTDDNEILLWKIDGFQASKQPAAMPPIPSPDVYTRSSFSPLPRSRGFQRLLSFSIPHTDRFYHRFGLLHEPGMRPILSMGDQRSTFLFWDLQKLVEGWDPSEEKKSKGAKSGRKQKNGVNSENLNRLDDLRAPSAASDAAGGATRKSKSTTSAHDRAADSVPLAMPSSTSLSAVPERKYALGNLYLSLKAHFSHTAKTQVFRAKKVDIHFATSQMAWSPDGTWLVACGDMGMIAVFHRDKSVVNGVRKADERSSELSAG